MKTILFLSLLVSSLAFADQSTTATPPKPEETVTISEEATAPLFERVRGALTRAVKDGKVMAVATTAPTSKTN